MRSLLIWCAVAACSGPAPEPDPAAAVARVRAEGRTAMAIMAEGFAARARGDEPAARAAFVLARAVAEAATGAPTRIVPGEAARIDRGLSGHDVWSPDGRYALFARSDGRLSMSEPNALFVVEAATGRVVRLDKATQPQFAPDHVHVIVQTGFEMTVIDLSTGQPVLGPRMSRISPAFTGDGRLVWTDRVGEEDRIYTKRLPNGRETILRAPARPRTDRFYQPAIESVDFVGDRVLGVAVSEGPSTWASPGTIHVWSPPLPDPIVTVEGFADPSPKIDPEGRLAYTTGDPKALRLELVDLATPGAKPMRFHASGPCGDGVTSDYHQFERCSPHHYMTVTGGRACIWDTRTGKLVTSIHDYGNDVSCDGDSVFFSGGEPDAPGTLVSISTGHVMAAALEESDGPPPPPAPEPEPDLPGTVEIAHTKVSLADGARARDLHVAPTARFVSGVVDATTDGGRARLWAAGGGVAWQGARPPNAVAVDFGSHGELVIAGGDGRVWHLDGLRALRTTPPYPGCGLLDGEVALPSRVLPDGRVAMFCRNANLHQVVVEGQPQAAVQVTGYSWHPALGASPTAASAALLDRDGVRVWDLPSGAPHPLVALSHADALAVSPRGDRIAVQASGALVLYDAAGHTLWSVKLDLASDTIVFSPDGTKLAAPMSRWGRQTIFDVASGKQLDQIESSGLGIAFDPTGTRIAVPTDDGIVLRDLATRRDVGRRAYPGKIDRFVDSVAWSPDGRIAAVVDGAITVWTDEVTPRLTVTVAGEGAAIFEDDRVRLLGDGRALVACQIGNEIYPFELCEDRIRL